jgi:hypothetical protein
MIKKKKKNKKHLDSKVFFHCPRYLRKVQIRSSDAIHHQLLQDDLKNNNKKKKREKKV